MVAGGYAYGYLFMSQNPFAQQVFTALLKEIRPARILEIGTFHGGLTLMLRDILDSLNLNNSIIKTYDINDQEFLKPLVKNKKIEVLTVNLFNDTYSDFINNNSKQSLLDFIQQSGTTLVLCDGGCKKCEFNLISPLLKKHDIIMAHDYAPNKEYFDTHIKNIIWDWLEIEDKDIQDVVINNNLQPYYQDTTQKAAWCCKIKN
jgi:hypothetical protein